MQSNGRMSGKKVVFAISFTKWPIIWQWREKEIVLFGHSVHNRHIVRLGGVINLLFGNWKLFNSVNQANNQKKKKKSKWLAQLYWCVIGVHVCVWACTQALTLYICFEALFIESATSFWYRHPSQCAVESILFEENRLHKEICRLCNLYQF